MWDDERQLNAAAATLALMAVAVLAYAAVAWLVRQPAFAFREVVVTTPLHRANGAYLEAVVRSELSGTFFTLDLARARSALAQVPWVRTAGLRRQWPRRLEIEIEEHAPLARWNEGGLVNTRGEVFVADWNGELPQFSGPPGASMTMTTRFRDWSAVVEPLALTVRGVALTPRGGWELRTDGRAGPLIAGAEQLARPSDVRQLQDLEPARHDPRLPRLHGARK